MSPRAPSITRIRRTGLWAETDFLRLWGASTVSTFGTLITRTALPFTAILVLDASAFQIALLSIAELVPGFVVGLAAGVWVDRVRRRPILIGTDLGRAALLATIPLAALLGALTLVHLIVVAALTSILSTCFTVAYRSYLPAMVRREALIEGNSKLTAAQAVAEAGAFGSGGWLVQALTAPIAILVDAITFLWSAFLVWRIRVPEPPLASSNTLIDLRAEISEGLHLTLTHPVLRGLVGSNTLLNLGYAITGTVFLLYVSQEVGFDPGVLGLIFSVGGVSSLVGAALVGRVTSVLGVGTTMIAALVGVAFGQGLILFVASATLNAVGILVAQQFVADSAATIYDVITVSVRQTTTPDRLLGRVNASFNVLETGAMIVGALVGGILGEVIGLRPTIGVAVAVKLSAAVWLARSPVRAMRVAPGEPGGDH